jgi:hypothetical protein
MSSPLHFPVGDSTWAVDVPADKRVPVERGDVSPVAATPAELLRAALANPAGLGVPLRTAFTPDDRVAIVLDDKLPHLNDLLSELLAEVQAGGVPLSAVTVVVPPTATEDWVDDLPDELGDIHAETHDPTDVKRVAFLGPSSTGRMVYLNRTVVEAEFVIVLSGRRFAPFGGYDGAEASLFPALSNAETLGGVSTAASRKADAEAVAFQLGTPFFVQIIEGPGDTVAEVVAGIGEVTTQGRKRQKARWGGRVGEKADLVIVGTGAVNEAEFAVAVANGRKCLADGGRLVILTSAADSTLSAMPPWGEDEQVFVGSGWDEGKLDELGAIRLGSERELARLVAAAGKVIVLPDAYKMRVRIGEPGLQGPRVASESA